MAGPIDLASCVANIDAESHDEYPTALIHLTETVEYPGRGEIARIKAIKINRRLLRGTFLQILDDESDELHRFSQTLFDKYGILKREFMDHEFHKGTGCWGEEVNQGQLLYITDIDVNEQYRHAGVGSWALQKLLTSDKIKDKYNDYYAFVLPSSATNAFDGTTPEQFNKNRDRSVAFFRKNGFRRVGRTPFFAYSSNPNHPSRSIPITDDAEGNSIFSTEEEEPLAHPPFNSAADEARMEEHVHKYFLHHFIAASSAAGSGGRSLPGMPQEHLLPPVENIVAQVNARDPQGIHKTDPKGMTPLHLAAGMHNVRAIRALLNRDLLGANTAHSELNRRDNIDGDTPLEACERDLRNMKEFSETMMGFWNGYDDEGLRSAYELRKAMGQNVGDEDSFIRPRRWGCTCGECVNGWLSPMISMRLTWQCDIYHDMMRDEPPIFKGGGGIKTEDAVNVGLGTMPPRMARKLTPESFFSYLTLLPAIKRVIESKRIPTSATVLVEAGTDAHAFIEQGGKVRYALELVIDVAEEQSPIGDNSWDEMMTDFMTDGDETGIRYRDMVRCANDLEFEMIRQKLGVPSRASWPREDSDDEESLGL